MSEIPEGTEGERPAGDERPPPPSYPGTPPPAPVPPPSWNPPPPAPPPPANPYGQPQPPNPGYPQSGSPPAYPSGGEAYGPSGTPPPVYGSPAYGPPGYGPPGSGPPGWGEQPPANQSGSLASYGPRLGGWLLDFVIVNVVALIITAPLRSVGAGRINFHVTTTTNGVTHIRYVHYSFISAAVYILIILLYGAIFCGLQGRTIGMRAARTRVIDGATGGPIGFWRGFGRGALEYLLFLVFFLPWVLDMLFPLWDSKNQTLHDKVVNSVVVRQ